jgi:hypothetical protein
MRDQQKFGVVYLFVVLETGSHSVAQASLKFTVLLLLPPQYRDNRGMLHNWSNRSF